MRTYEVVRDNVSDVINIIKNFGRDEEAYYQVCLVLK